MAVLSHSLCLNKTVKCIHRVPLFKENSYIKLNINLLLRLWGRSQKSQSGKILKNPAKGYSSKSFTGRIFSKKSLGEKSQNRGYFPLLKRKVKQKVICGIMYCEHSKFQNCVKITIIDIIECNFLHVKPSANMWADWAGQIGGASGRWDCITSNLHLIQISSGDGGVGASFSQPCCLWICLNMGSFISPI